MKSVPEKGRRRGVSCGSSWSARWWTIGVTLAVVALNGWGVSRIGWDFSFIYLGDGDRAAYIPAVFIPTAHAVSLAITTVSMLVLWRWSSRTGTYFRVGKPAWNWIDAALLAVLVVLLGGMFLLVMNWGPPPFPFLSPIFNGALNIPT